MPPTIKPVFICAFDGSDETEFDAVSDVVGVAEGSDGKFELVVVEIELELGAELELGEEESPLVPSVTVGKLTIGIDVFGAFPCRTLLQQSPTKTRLASAFSVQPESERTSCQREKRHERHAVQPIQTFEQSHSGKLRRTWHSNDASDRFCRA